MDKQAYSKAITYLNHLVVFDPNNALGHKQRGLCWDHEEEVQVKLQLYQLSG